MSTALKPLYSAQQLRSRVTALGRVISHDYIGRALDLVVMLESAFMFAADLMRRLSVPVICHFVRVEIHDVQFGGRNHREVYFGRPPRLEHRDVLVVDAVMQSGLTQEFLMRRIEEGRPRSLRLAVLLDKPQERRVNLRPDYFCFAGTSKYLAGYGLAGSRGWYRNISYIGIQPRRAREGRAGQGSPVRRVR